MAETTPIGWCDSTWNTLRGCSRITEGCRNCYAERMAARNLPAHRSPTTGKPFAIMTPSGPRWTGEVEFIESQLDLPLRWRRGRKIFVNSMSDTFHEQALLTWLDCVFAVMALCPQHTFIVPTKRAWAAQLYLKNRYLSQRIHEQVKARMGYDNPKRPAINPSDLPLPNVILLASVANQADADRDIPTLLDTPSAVRGISLEPMLGPVDLRRWLRWPTDSFAIPVPMTGQRLDWCIVGAESGPGARPCNVEWIRDVVRQCADAGVPCFVKQLGARPIVDAKEIQGWPLETKFWLQQFAPEKLYRLSLLNRAGADPAEWAKDLRVQQRPERSDR